MYVGERCVIPDYCHCIADQLVSSAPREGPCVQHDQMKVVDTRLVGLNSSFPCEAAL